MAAQLKKQYQCLVLFCLYFCLCVESLRPGFPYRKHHHAREADNTGYNYKTAYFEQKIDHFGFANDDTYKQRYLVADQYWDKNGGPIFFYTGNEGDIAWFCNNTGFMWELAPKLNALLVFAEHRYYGTSLPYGPDAVKDPKKLQYLTSEQALADFAVLIQELKANVPGAQTSKVIAFGGSYGGMLAAWLRIKYPNVVYGSLAASAPIWSFIGQIPCDAQLQVVTNSFKRESLTCVKNIRKSWGIINTMGATDSGRARLSTTFDLCALLNSTADTEALKSWLVEIMFNLAMVDYPYPASFLEPLPGWPIKAVCAPLSTEVVDEVALIEALSKAVKVYYNYTGQAKCLNVNENAVGSLGDELWGYQACTEMVMPSCSNGVTDMFEPAPYNFSQISDQCYKQFKVRPRKSWVITQYLGKSLSAASNIIFSNGLLDPWSSGGVLKSISPSLTAFVIPNGAHHVDLRSSNPGDTPDITKTRLAEEYIIHKKWIEGDNL
ncbi:lysosomal Pro-X carboxypeptidase-like [Mizuhopecten yessoensis]|uniref:Lysosomal Pro-X carboxypeptidase n=1 Tax=Mizuhopecten yessoensis TaxID=6573 RepID=A0A210QD13_MIZYE|nr:lysosomal Pro-X carboxypeptidase-like [Mizuhopecten yessoensis]OWF46619.1 Lysosomal Pro-X carboxypeptidase [Mizuhopecten yessoensis]